jgi:plastocyanin
LVAGFLLLVLAGCGSSPDAAPAAAPSATAAPTAGTTSGATAAATTAAAPVLITIKDFAFAVPAAVPAGATVQVKNDDTEAHTVTADAGGFDVMVAPGATATFTAPAMPGSVPFHCTYHSNMHGVLVVS